jgi:hypothetical protein
MADARDRNNFLFRLTEQQRAVLGQRAAEHGLAIQHYLELVALGEIRQRSKGGRPFKLRDQEPLLDIAS